MDNIAPESYLLQLPQPLPVWQVFHGEIFMGFHWTRFCASMSLLYSESKLDVPPQIFLLGLRWGEGSSPSTCWQPVIAWQGAANLCHRTILLTCSQFVVNLFSTQIPSPFLQRYFPATLPQPAAVSGIITLEMQDFIIPLVELYDFPPSPFLQALGVLNCIRHFWRSSSVCWVWLIFS